MRTSLRRKLDEVAEGFWEDAELNEFLNEGYYNLWDYLLSAKHHGAIAVTDLDIVADTAEIALPSDFHEARLVERVTSTGTVPLWWNERFDQPNYIQGSTVDDYFLPNITFRGQNLVLEPTPDASLTGGVRLTYFFLPGRMSDDADVPDLAIHDFYHDLMVYKAVLLAKAKEEAVGGGGASLGPWGVIMGERLEKFKQNIEKPTNQRLAVQPFEV